MHSRLLLTVLLIFSSAIVAEPVVVYDSGQTVSGEKYRVFFSTDIKPDFIKDGWMFKSEPMPDESAANKPTETTVFPVETTRLTPGKIADPRDQYIATLPGPMCIVGADALSRQWIKRNYKTLRASNAMCIIVQAKTEAEANDIASMLNGLMVSLGDGDVLSDYFKIKHYPVYITERSISQ